MRRYVILILVMFTGLGTAFADGHMKSLKAPEGNWSLERGIRLYQNAVDAPRAKLWLNVPQQGSMIYEFTMRYEGGAEDGHGGVGLHILADTAPTGKSWGMGHSWMLWLNYDKNPTAPGIPEGLSAQIYQSTSNEDMEIIQSISLKRIESIAARYLNTDVPVKLTYAAEEGRIYIADPRGITLGWYVDLPNGRNITGNYVAIRTNGVKASFTSNDAEL